VSGLSGVLPWTRSCLVCGEENPRGFHLRSRLENGAVVLDYTPRESDLGYRHLVHGGVLMTLLDEVMTWAAIVAARGICVAAEISVRLKAPVAEGEPLRFEARVSRHARRLILTEATARDTRGAVVAEASGKYMPDPSGRAGLQFEDFVASPESIDLRVLFPDLAK
jgi:uncharacterized protein (TIGR00369 family)